METNERLVYRKEFLVLASEKIMDIIFFLVGYKHILDTTDIVSDELFDNCMGYLEDTQKIINTWYDVIKRVFTSSDKLALKQELEDYMSMTSAYCQIASRVNKALASKRIRVTTKKETEKETMEIIVNMINEESGT